jgi:ribosomal protein S27AE
MTKTIAEINGQTEEIGYGDNKVKQCPNCGESVYLIGEEHAQLCPRCGGVTFHFARRN